MKGVPADRTQRSSISHRPASFILLAAGLLSATLYGQTTLEPGRITGRELADGQAHEYSCGLEAGQYARVSVDQRSSNVTVAVFAPDGKELYSGDSYAI